MNEQEMKQFGAWVKQQRTARHMTQAQLAAALGIASGSLSAIEAGHTKAIGKKMVAALQEYFKNEEGGHAANPLELGALQQAMPLLYRLAKVAAAPGFQERVQKVAAALECSEEKAIAAIFIQEVQK